MAIVKYPAGDLGPVNDGEERLRKYLEVHLDDNFTLIPNLNLPYTNPKNEQLQILEYDMLVVAPHGVFNIENKDWGGHLDGDDNYWYINGKERRNPHKTNFWKGKVLNGFLRQQNPSWQRAWIHSMVTLSNIHQNVSNIYGRSADNTFLLEQKLTDYIDDSNNINKRFDEIEDIQQGIVEYLTGAHSAKKAEDKSIILEYEVLEVLDQKDNYAEYLVKPANVSSSIRYRLKEFSLGLSKLPLDERKKQINIAKNQYNALRKIKTNPFILNVDFQFDEESNTFYEITEFQDENTLQSELQRKDFTDDEKWSMIKSICEAVKAAHNADVYHRDISPNNIFITSSYATLGNFGKSYFFDHHNEGYTVLNSISKDHIGPYHALELLNEDAGRYTDIYSIGVLIYRLFVGQLPVKDCIELNAEGGVLKDARLPSKVNPHLPQWLDELARKTIASDSDDRFDNIDELLDFINESRKAQLETSTISKVTSTETKTWTGYKEVSELVPGDRVGTYTLVKELGRGGFSRVFMVKHSLQGKEYAMKIFNESVDAKSAINEYQALKDLKHPNIVKFEWNDQLASGQFFTVMEYVNGEDIKKYTKPELSLPSYRLHELIRSILDSLVYMQSQEKPLFHRDIKPTNILYAKDQDRFILIDFNVASDASNTEYAGTGPYIAPDLASSSHEVNYNESGDPFALGTTIYKLVCKEFPWKKGMPIPNVEPTRPEVYNDKISNRFADFIFKSIQPKAENRFNSAKEMFDAFSEFEASDLLKQIKIEKQEGVSSIAESEISVVDYINSLYSQSKYGNAGTRVQVITNEYDTLTYTETKLDKKLVPAILDGNFKLVIITGNAGDGKTALIKNIEDRAQVVERFANNNGASFNINGVNFKSNYDGSQDENEKENSDVLDDFFNPFANSENILKSNEGRVIAINEGRLVDFLTTHKKYAFIANVITEYFENKGNVELPKGLIVVNLNLRSVSAHSSEEESILKQQVKKLVDTKLWKACETCSKAPHCFIKYNVETLRDSAAGVEVINRLETLLHAASLKREFHITMRDLRSFLAYMLTRDHSCADVEASYRRAENEMYDYFKNFYFNITDHKAIDSGNQDRLVALIRSLDVALTPLPVYDRDLYFDKHKEADFIDFEERSFDLLEIFNKEKRNLPAHELHKESLTILRNWHNLFSRHQYFEGSIDSRFRIPYPGLYEFNRLIQDPQNKELLNKTLVGIAKAIALNEGCDRSELYENKIIITSTGIRDPFSKSFRLFPLSDFELIVNDETTLAPYLEYTPDSLILQHKKESHISMRITMDLFQMLDFIQKGFTPSVNDMKGQFVELEIFKNLLENLEYNEVILTQDNQDYFSIKKTTQTELSLSKMEF